MKKEKMSPRWRPSEKLSKNLILHLIQTANLQEDSMATGLNVSALFNRKLLMDVFGEAFGYCSGCSLGNKQ